MKTFTIIVDEHEFQITPALHSGFYTVNHGMKSAVVGRDEEGYWTTSMQTSEATDLPVEAIGRAIEQKLAAGK